MNKKTISTALIAFMAIFSASMVMAGVPNGYYNSLVGKHDKALKDAIQTLVAPHTVQS